MLKVSTWKDKIIAELSQWIPFWDFWQKSVVLISHSIMRHPKIVALIVAGVSLLAGSLCLSDMIFLRFLGYPWFTDWNGMNFLSYAPEALSGAECRHWVVAFLIPLALGFFAGISLFEQKNGHKKLFGDAHWASVFEVKKAGLFSEEGLILGKRGHRFIRASGFEHVFVFAPSGSGKTASLVMSNLLTWHDSCIVQDVKGSIFKTTSGFRAKNGHACYYWNPGTRDSHTHAYNPLDFISKNPLTRIDDLQKIATIFIPDEAGSTGQFFASTSRQLFVGLILYLLDTPGKLKTLGEMNRLVKGSANFPEWITETLKQRKDLDPLCYSNLLSFVNAEPRTRGNIHQSFISQFELFDNPLVDAATSRSDFDITQFRKKRMTVYVAAGSDNLSRLSPLLTVFYQQTIDYLLRDLPRQDEPHGLLMMLDEFSALKRMEILRSSIGLMREYRIRVMAIIQDLPQLYVTYGHDGAQAFINNKYRIAFAQNNTKAAQLISEWLGTKTVEQKSHQNSRGASQQSSESRSFIKVPLKRPDEIMKLAFKKMIIAVEGNEPILCNKAFFDDAGLKNRVMAPIPLPFLPVSIQPFDHEAMLVAFEKKEAEKKAYAIKQAKSEEYID